jgi:DNA-binding transcriptional regulator YhcF (GntR family)
VAAELRRALAEAEAKPGERLPPAKAKDLARALGVNANTVLRALRELQEEGLLELRRGKVITVAGRVQVGVHPARYGSLAGDLYHGHVIHSFRIGQGMALVAL